MSFIVSAGIAAAGAVVGGVIASKGAKSAANTQAQAAQDSNATNKAMFDEQVALNAPFRDNGLAANNRLAFLLGLGGQNPGSTGAPASPAPTGPTGPTPSFGGLSSQMLTAGAAGSFQPSSAPQVETSDAIRQRLAPQFGNDTAGLEAAVMSQGSGEQQALQQFQQSVQQYQQQQQAIQQGHPLGNTLNGAGSLAQPFSQADFAADGAPKAPAFDQAVPTAQEFGQFQDGTNLGQFQDNTNLGQFEDMPAFNPDMLKEDPGYQFRLDQGTKGLTNQYAGKGDFFSGQAMKGLDRYNQDYASGEYGNAFNRYQTTRGNKLQDYLTNQNTQQANRSNALSTYNTNIGTQQANRANALQDYQTNLGTQQQNYQNQNTAYNTNLNQYSLNRANALQDYSSAFDRFQTNRSNVINPLLSLSGAGQQATNQQSNAAQNYGAQSAAAVTGAGNAMAAGQVGSANALGGAFSGAANAYGQNQLMNLLLSRQPGGASSTFANSPMSSSLLFSNGSLGD